LRDDVIGLETFSVTVPDSGQLLHPLDITSGNGWFQFQAETSAILTAAVLEAENATIQLYTGAMLPVVIGQGAWLLNARVEAGETYVLYVSAGNAAARPVAVLAMTQDAGIPFTPFENGQFTNPANPLDVNGDGKEAPLDALLVINDINARGVRPLLGPHTDPPYVDVNDDEYVTPMDVLQVINRLNEPTWQAATHSSPQADHAEGEAGEAQGALGVWPTDVSSRDAHNAPWNRTSAATSVVRVDQPDFQPRPAADDLWDRLTWDNGLNAFDIPDDGDSPPGSEPFDGLDLLHDELESLLDVLATEVLHGHL
jgi:hypothetical protein